nr:LamG-like jellyroll fold domain-containing protein [uncultured Draconibacterium sp.]
MGETEAPSNLGVSYFYSSGTSDYSIYNNGLIGNESDKSISVWVNQTSRPTSRIYQETTGLSSNNEDRYDLLISSTTGLIYYRMIEYGGADVRLTSVTTLNLNTWYHILVTSDGSTHTVYIDGVYDNSVTGTPSTSMTLERTILGNG